jgi:hypothetical protein
VEADNDDGDPCTLPGCDASGVCQPDHTTDPLCITEICRTPGFWCTHECGEDGLDKPDCEKSDSVNITQRVITYGGPLEICGETIDKTSLNCPGSALEALCVSQSNKDKNKVNQNLQLARQLTAAALNCIMSGGGSNCSDTSIEVLFGECNSLCAGIPDNAMTVTSCISALDCYNNGGKLIDDSFCQTGTCEPVDDLVVDQIDGGIPCNEKTICPEGFTCVPLEGNCHDQPLCLDPVTPTLCFEPTGPAGSSKASNKAIANDCTILAPANCECSD